MLLTQGWKITYSGDCRPTDALIQEGMNSTVVIHEATFQSSMEKQARMKMHSTIEEAVRVGMKMNAHRVVLTHFSQRYTVSESISKKKTASNEEKPEIREFIKEAGVMAIDQLQFKLSQLVDLPVLSPVINFGVSDDN